MRSAPRWNGEQRTLKARPTSWVVLVAISVSLLRTIARGQMTSIPTDQRLTSSNRESKTEQQWLADVDSSRKAIETQPNSAQVHLMLGRSLHALGETEAASRAFDRALNLNPKLAVALFEKGSILADQAEWSQAADLFRRAVAASPDYTLAHLALGDMLLRAGEFENSTSELRSVLRLDPNNSEAYQGLGLIHLQEGDFDGATANFRRALAIRPGYVDAERGLGHALASAHEWPEAAKLLKQVLATNPDSTQEVVALGTVLAKMGDPVGAQTQFARARELSNKEVTLLRAKGDNNWGVALRLEGKLEDAVDAFRRALDEDSSFCEAHDNLGGVLWMQKDSAAAMSEFQAAVRCNPDLATAQNNLGTALLYHSHDIDQAIVQFRAAISLRPGFALAHLNLGKALAAKQELAQAEPEFRRAIMIDPDLAAAHVGLGLLLAIKEGSLTAEARLEMEKGLRLDAALRELIPQPYLAQLH